VTIDTDFTCQELVELVSDYIEDELSSEDRARFEMHLVYCRGCDVYVDQMRETLRLMGTLSEDSLDDPARESLLKAFRGWKREGGHR
jgi:anti-sigma factor RsiW